MHNPHCQPDLRSGLYRHHRRPSRHRPQEGAQCQQQEDFHHRDHGPRQANLCLREGLPLLHQGNGGAPPEEEVFQGAVVPLSEDEAGDEACLDGGMVETTESVITADAQALVAAAAEAI